MRNKIFIISAVILFGSLLVWPPIAYVLDKTGVLPAEDMANYIDPKRLSLKDVPFQSRTLLTILNGIERGKAGIETVYTNYMPFYTVILNSVRSAEISAQDGFVNYLYGFERTKKAANGDGMNETPQPTAMPDEMLYAFDLLRIPYNAASMTFHSNRVEDFALFRTSQLREVNGAFGFLDIGVALTYDQAYENMLVELAHTNRIADALSKININFFAYYGTIMQFTDYYEDYNRQEPSFKPIFEEFLEGISESVTAYDYLDIDTFEKRMMYMYKTDHHWNAFGAYRGYEQVIEMMRWYIPGMGGPYPLERMHVFPGVLFRGSGARGPRIGAYYDTFTVPIISGMPQAHQSQRVLNKFNEYENGNYDNYARPPHNLDFAGHYENYYHIPPIISYPTNNTGRRLLILGDSISYWVAEPISAHFDVTHYMLAMGGDFVNLEEFCERNGITDVLLLQYGPRITRATTATRYMEQFRTR
jgi:hypothetical protein